MKLTNLIRAVCCTACLFAATTVAVGQGCPLDCPLDGFFEPEPCGNDDNGGCNSDPPAFTAAACGQTWCGTGWADGGTRDTDWYLVEHGGGVISATVVSQFSSVCFIVDGIDTCAPAVVGVTGSGNDCANLVVAEADVPAGTYVVFVASDSFEGVPCGGGNNDYVVTIECTPGGGPCGAGAGDCCADNGTPGCDDPACCELICSIDPFCCDVFWDSLCAIMAADLCFPLCEIGGPANNDCENADPIENGSTKFSNVDATSDGPMACGLMGSDIWYDYNADFNGDLAIDTCGSGFDTVISVYDGCACPADLGNLLACNDDCGGDPCSGLQSCVTVPVVAGNCYKIQVGGFNGSQGTGIINVTKFPVFVPGACCFAGGACEELLEDECIAQGGEFQGEDIPCNPCPQPTGACCISGNCIDDLTQADCEGQGGEYQGDDVTCAGVSDGYTLEACNSMFVDISGIGIEAPTASNVDDGGDVVPLGFSFEFFGDTHTDIGIASNGYLTFGGDLSDFTNDAIPSPEDPNDAIFPYWDDWSPNQGGTVHYITLNDPLRFMAQWTDVPHFSGSGTATFQAILFADSNCIMYRYGTPLNLDSPTVGVENQDGTDGLDAGVPMSGDCVLLCPLLTDPVDCPSPATLDIKPGSCPNPVNTGSNGVIPVGLLGSDGFDVTQIDLRSLAISRADGVGGSVAPHEGPPGPHTTLGDVGTPFDGELCDCHELEGDGILDVNMKFKTQLVVDALQLKDLPDGTFVELCVSGVLLDGTPFSACDCIRVKVHQGGGGGNAVAVDSNVPGAWIDLSLMDEYVDGGGFTDGGFTRYYSSPVVLKLTHEPVHEGWLFGGWMVNGQVMPSSWKGKLTVDGQVDVTVLWATPHDQPVVPGENGKRGGFGDR